MRARMPPAKPKASAESRYAVPPAMVAAAAEANRVQRQRQQAAPRDSVQMNEGMRWRKPGEVRVAHKRRSNQRRCEDESQHPGAAQGAYQGCPKEVVLF